MIRRRERIAARHTNPTLADAGAHRDHVEAMLNEWMDVDDPGAWFPVNLGNGRTLWRPPRGRPQA